MTATILIALAAACAWAVFLLGRGIFWLARADALAWYRAGGRLT